MKKQTGLRIDRFLYERFQRQCLTEKLRPGEAVEHLIRLAVDTGSIGEVYARTTARRSGQVVDDVLFASRLSRLKATLEYERTRLENGDMVNEEDRISDVIIEELAEIGRRSVNEELIKEFQKTITEADMLYEKSEKKTAEDRILPGKRGSTSISPATILRDNPHEDPDI